LLSLFYYLIIYRVVSKKIELKIYQSDNKIIYRRAGAKYNTLYIQQLNAAPLPFGGFTAVMQPPGGGTDATFNRGDV